MFLAKTDFSREVNQYIMRLILIGKWRY